jgi:hypothetical protein
LTFEEEPSSVKAWLATRWIRIPAHSAPSQSPGFATCRSQQRRSVCRPVPRHGQQTHFRDEMARIIPILPKIG